MADIKKLSIFGNQSKGLNKIKAETQKQKETQKTESEDLSKQAILEIRPVPKIKQKIDLDTSLKSTIFTRSVGAPIRNHDQVFSAKQPLKLSAIVVSLTRVLSEKYMTENSRDEILRLALNDYIKHNLTKEDKRDLLHDMEKELSIYREKHPTYSRYDESGRMETPAKEIENETMEYLKYAWGIKKE